MKIGYSNLLGEHLQAEVIHHKDCEPFQVVCPACREPVFKVERTEDGGGIHYLSHYAAAKSFQDDCELRVSALPTELISQDNRTSRDQRLQYFLQVLRDMVAKDKIYTGSPPHITNASESFESYRLAPSSALRDGEKTFLVAE